MLPITIKTPMRPLAIDLMAPIQSIIIHASHGIIFKVRHHHRKTGRTTQNVMPFLATSMAGMNEETRIAKFPSRRFPISTAVNRVVFDAGSLLDPAENGAVSFFLAIVAKMFVRAGVMLASVVFVHVELEAVLGLFVLAKSDLVISLADFARDVGV